MRPLTLGDVLDGMFRMFLSNWRTYAIAIGVIIVPMNFAASALTGMLGFNQGLLQQLNNPAAADAVFEAGPALVPLVLLGVIAIVEFVFIRPYIVGVACRVAGEDYEGRQPGPAVVLRWTARRYLSLLVVRLIMILITVVLFAIPSGLIAAAIGTDAPALGVIGGLLIVVLIPAWIYVMVRFWLATPAIVMEAIGPIEALRRSTALVRGRWWPLFGTLLLAGFIVWAISSILTFPFSLPGQLIGGTVGIILLAIGTTVAGIVTSPLSANARTLLYYDGRIRKEGYDLQMMTSEILGEGGQTPDTEPPFG